MSMNVVITGIASYGIGPAVQILSRFGPRFL